MMPVCLHPCTRAINRVLPGWHPWSATADHIRAKALGGRDIPANLRAAHRHCNMVAGRRWQKQEHLRRKAALRKPVRRGILPDGPAGVLGGPMPWPEQAALSKR